MKTAVEWLVERLQKEYKWFPSTQSEIIKEALEMEKNNIDNKVIHFAEWLTNKHTITLTALYEEFEKEYYSKNL